MATLTIEVPEAFRAALTRLAESLQHREPLMRAISEDMYDAVMENFAQEGRPPWLPIERAGKILQQSGRLAASIDTAHDNDAAVVGTNVVYARIHQQGGTTKPHEIRPRNRKALRFNGRFARKVNHPGSRIPARPFLAVTDEDYQTMEGTINQYLSRVLDK